MKNVIKLAFFAIVAIHVIVLLKIKFFPYPEIFIYSYLTNSGLIPYTQIIDQHFPGLFFFPINLFTLGFDTVERMRILSIILVTTSHYLIYVISNRLLKDKALRLFPNLLFLIWHPMMEGYVLWIDSFAQVCLLASFCFILSDKSLGKFLSGVSLGVTFLLKQTVAPLIFIIMLYLFLTKSNRRHLLLIISGILICVLFLAIWVVIKGNWEDFYYWTFIFNITTFAQMGRKLPQIGELAKVLPILVTPMVVSYLFLKERKIHKSLVLLFTFFFGSLFFAFARFDYVHLQPALPFAILTFVYALTFFRKFTYMKLILTVYVITFTIFNLAFTRHLIGNEVLFFGESESKFTEQVNNIRRGGKVFAFGTTPHIYYLTKTLPPGNVFVFQFPWFMKNAESTILTGLINDPPNIVLRDKEAQVAGLNLIKYMPAISEYVDKYYTSVKLIDGVEFMTRNQ